MSNDERMTKPQYAKETPLAFRHLSIRTSFVIRASSLTRRASRRSLPIDLATLSLQFTAFAFRFQNALLKRAWARRAAAARLFPSRNLCRALLFLRVFDCIQQPFARESAILRLRSRILDRHADTRWQVPQRHRRRNLVYILSTGSAGPGERFHKIDIANAKFSHSFGWFSHRCIAN